VCFCDILFSYFIFLFFLGCRSHLQDLKKFTAPTHCDYASISAALALTEKTATYINDKNKKFTRLSEVAIVAQHMSSMISAESGFGFIISPFCPIFLIFLSDFMWSFVVPLVFCING
jgi:hypothetical protein